LQLGYKPEQVILYGYSMGTAMAAHVASVKPAKALILESAFATIGELDWVNNTAPAYQLNTIEKAPAINIPTLLIHGDSDKVIPPEHTNRIFQNLASPVKQQAILEEGGHGNLRSRPGYQNLVTGFIGSLP
jgi:pimeloyl-ACP methyl ester carboxylesterase